MTTTPENRIELGQFPRTFHSFLPLYLRSIAAAPMGAHPGGGGHFMRAGQGSGSGSGESRFHLSVNIAPDLKKT